MLRPARGAHRAPLRVRLPVELLRGRGVAVHGPMVHRDEGGGELQHSDTDVPGSSNLGQVAVDVDVYKGQCTNNNPRCDVCKWFVFSEIRTFRYFRVNPPALSSSQ